MKKSKLIILLLVAILLSMGSTYALFKNSSLFNNEFYTRGYKIDIYPNGGKIETPNLFIKNNQTKLPNVIRDGYSFKGFSLDKNGKVIFNSNIDNISKINNNKLYVIWDVINYKISYDLSGGKFRNGEEINNYTTDSENVELPKPIKDGYDFVGWTGSNGNVPTKNIIIPKGSINDKNYKANWNIVNYKINFNLDGGVLDEKIKDYNIESKIKLPIPKKEGYEFLGWIGEGIDKPTIDVILENSFGNKTFEAKWKKKVYVVNYYVNNSVWATRNVGYNEPIENLNAQSVLDGYHTFHGWDGFVDKMPSHDVNLKAKITEAYCQLVTGHGPYANATGLLKVFNNAGWSGKIIEPSNAPGYYLVMTDFNLTRAEAEHQKNYIANHTNYMNYNYPFLYWVSINCTNGYSMAWTRSPGHKDFN